MAYSKNSFKEMTWRHLLKVLDFAKKKHNLELEDAVTDELRYRYNQEFWNEEFKKAITK